MFLTCDDRPKSEFFLRNLCVPKLKHVHSFRSLYVTMGQCDMDALSKLTVLR